MNRYYQDPNQPELLWVHDTHSKENSWINATTGVRECDSSFRPANVQIFVPTMPEFK